MTVNKHIPEEDLALYAMQAMTPQESGPVKAHLAACEECRAGLAEVSGDLALLAAGVDQQPLPQGARQRFLDRIQADAAPASAGPESARQSSVFSTHARKKPARWPVWIAWGAVAALLALAAMQQIRIGTLNRQLDQQATLLKRQSNDDGRAQAVLNLLTAPSAQHVVLSASKTRPAPTARAVYLPSTGALILEAGNLDPVPGNKTYELWIIPTSGAPVPAGLFRPDAAGNASLVLPTLPKGVQARAFGVTVEDAAGSSTPTLPIVLQGAPSPAGE